MTKKLSLLLLSAISSVCIVGAAVLTLDFTVSADESECEHINSEHTNSLNSVISTSASATTATSSSLSSSGEICSSGTYYLSEDINLSSTTGATYITIGDGSTSIDVTICLNGYTITGNGDGSVITVKSGATLTLCDCKGGGKITGGNCTNNGKYYGGGVYVASGGEFIMEGGTITGNTASYGGGIYNLGTVTIAGGVIYGNTATYTACVGIYSDTGAGDLIISGGFIIDTVSVALSAPIIKGGYYPSSAIEVKSGIGSASTTTTIYGSTLDTGSYKLFSQSELSKDTDLKNFLKTYNYSADTLYGVYTISENDYEVSYIDSSGKITYDGEKIVYGTDFVIKVTRSSGTKKVDESAISITYYLDSEVTEPINAGTYTLIVTPKTDDIDYDSKCYYPSGDEYKVEVELVITKATLTDNTNNTQTYTYDGNKHGVEFDLEGFVNGESLDSLKDATINYSEKTEEETEKTVKTNDISDWSEIEITLTTVGSKTVYYCITFDNYETVNGSCTISVTQAAVTDDKFPEIPTVYVDCGSSLSSVVTNCDGWTISTGTQSTYSTTSDNVTYGNTYTVTVCYSLAGVDTSNYDWDTAATEHGMTYDDTKKCLEYSVTVTVTHDSSSSDLKEYSANDAGCDTDGNYAYWYCEDCEKYFNEDLTEEYEENEWVIPAGHSYSYKVITVPTADSTGKFKATCTVCNFSVTNTLPELSDSAYTIKTTATCEEAGINYYYFTDEEYGIEVCVAEVEAEALGHDYSYSLITSPTDDSEGEVTATCSICGSVYKITLPTLSSGKYSKVETLDPDCESKGYTKYYYIDEEDGINYVYTKWIDATGHDLEEVESGKWHCKTCDKYFTDQSATVELLSDTASDTSDVAGIVLLALGGAMCVILGSVLLWQVGKKRVRYVQLHY